jgi:hypothetical protein
MNIIRTYTLTEEQAVEFRRLQARCNEAQKEAAARNGQLWDFWAPLGPFWDSEKESHIGTTMMQTETGALVIVCTSEPKVRVIHHELVS